MVNMKIDHFVVGPVQTNCYFVTNIKTKEMIIIDPGACANQLAKKVDESGAKPVAILLTHGHFDHATDAKPLADRYGIKIYIHEADKATLDDPQLNVSYMMGQSKTFYADVFLKDKQELDIAGFHIVVLHTPGHTPGGCCYYMEQEDVLFSGDTLFRTSVGRSDFPGGSASALVRSVKEKLLILPEETHVYPGHMEETTIGYEKRHNPFV